MKNNEVLQEVTLLEMLDARERRVWRQEELREKYPGHTLLCFTMNIAGPVKNSPLIRRGFRYGCSLIREQLMRIRKKALHEAFVDESTGNEAFFVIGLPPLEVKKMAVEIEDNAPIGRLFDMDVLDENGRKIDRSELGLPARACLLCGQPAKICARSRSHSVEQLRKKTQALLQDFIHTQDLQTIAQDACRALLYEVCTTPKPGLVDRANNGSHRDMDIFTFMDSAAVLQPYFYRCGEIGMGTRNAEPTETFRQLRQAGIAAEHAMLRVTHGVNTHKGAIFSIGIACAALGRLDHELWACPESVLSECGRIASGVTERDFARLSLSETICTETLTAGEKLFLQYGIRGVRGQAEEGYPTVLHAGLPVLERELASHGDINRAGSVAMLAILCADTDTNLIARGGREVQLAVTDQVRQLLRDNPSPCRETIETLDRQFIDLNLSPGGSADLLGLCYLLHFLKEEEREQKTKGGSQNV